MRHFRGIAASAVMAIGILWSAFQLWTGGIEIMVAMQQRAVHLMFTEILIFLLFPMRKKWVKSRWALGVDLVLAAVSAYLGLYVFVEYEVLTQRIGITTTMDLVLGSVAVILLLEATRRAIGFAMLVDRGRLPPLC